MRVQDLKPVTGKAVVEITGSGTEDSETTSGLLVVHDKSPQGYQVNLDWEQGTVLALGEGDWEPVEVGDEVLVQAPSGGVAGADIGEAFGYKRGQLVVVEIEEIVCKVE